MTQKKIIKIGMDIPNTYGAIEEIHITDKISLLDYDIIIINPSISYFNHQCNDNYQGKPSLNDKGSLDLKDCLNHWKREIRDAVKADKNVFLFLNKIEEFMVATGRAVVSGRGIVS